MKRKKAAIGVATRQNECQRIPYAKADSLSSFKLAIGELLLFGDRQREEFWLLFEALLAMQYRSVSQSGRKGGEALPGATKSGNGGIG